MLLGQTQQVYVLAELGRIQKFLYEHEDHIDNSNEHQAECRTILRYHGCHDYTGLGKLLQMKNVYEISLLSAPLSSFSKEWRAANASSVVWLIKEWLSKRDGNSPSLNPYFFYSFLAGHLGSNSKRYIFSSVGRFS